MNKLIFWIVGFVLLGLSGLVLNGSFGPQSYLIISIVTVIMLIIMKVLSFGDIFISKNNTNIKPSFSWSKENILYVVLAVFFMLIMFSYGFRQADIDKIERKIKYQKMSISELGHYITDINTNNGIDIATYIEKSEFIENRIRFYYVVSMGVVSKSLVFNGNARERNKKEIIEDIRQEDCSKTAFLTFLEKGGVMEYIYHEKIGNHKQFMFDINITYDMCLNR